MCGLFNIMSIVFGDYAARLKLRAASTAIGKEVHRGVTADLYEPRATGRRWPAISFCGSVLEDEVIFVAKLGVYRAWPNMASNLLTFSSECLT